jgi:hypothetical protein
MPVVTQFKRVETTRSAKQPTDVVATYKIVTTQDGKSLFQVDTGGSKSRQNPGKQSQTFQLTRESAKELWNLLGSHYGFGK